MNYTDITMKELKELQVANPQLIVIDVRTEAEVSGGMIDGAIHHNIIDMERFITETKQYSAQPVAVYCQSGGRSKLAAATLSSNDFANIYNCTEGYPLYK